MLNQLVSWNSLPTPFKLLNIPKILLRFGFASYAEYKLYKVVDFLKCVDLSLETMSKEQQSRINEKIASLEGRKLLFQFLETATATNSKVGLMALALIYCKDPDFIFDEFIQKLLLIAIKDLDDYTIDFFIAACTRVKKQKIPELPYHRVSITYNSKLINEGWSLEETGLLVRHLQNLSLLLPDPCSSSPYAGRDSSWLVEYGISDNTMKISKLFQKAKVLSVNYDSK